jgi:hypothetical protein
MKSQRYISVCLDCGGETQEQFCGDEGWTVCQDCGTVEGDTEEMTIEEWENKQR